MYEVVLTKRAEGELNEQRQWWAENRSVDQAIRWYAGFIAEMFSLELSPQRSALAEESPYFPYEVFQLNYGLSGRLSHRALYAVVKKKVIILRIRHLRQAKISEEDA